MTAFPTYQTGTVAIGAAATSVVGVGTVWSGVNVRPGDTLLCAGHEVAIMNVVDTTHLTIEPWPYTAVVAGAAYKIIQNSPLRFAGASAMTDVSALVAALNTTGFYVFVGAAETVPDPSLGEENQFAYKPGTGQTWWKTGGVWTFLGFHNGFGIAAPWSGATNYSYNDVATLAGSSYICVLPHINQTPPNATYWQVLAAKGDASTVPGPSGTNGVGYGGTSATSLLIANLVTKVFTTQAGLAYQVGNYVRASSLANGANYMEGLVSAYSGTSLSIAVTKIGGAGTFADWRFAVSGSPGVDYGNPQPPSGTLSLSSTSPYPTADVTAATNFYYHARGPAKVPVWNTSLGDWEMLPFTSSFTCPLDSNGAHVVYQPANSVFDIYAFKHPSTGLLAIGIGGAWTDFTSGRGVTCTDIVRKDGIWVSTLNQYIRVSAAGDTINTHYFLINASQATYLGTIGTVAAGQSEDSKLKRLLSNAYNTKRRTAIVKYPGGYSYNGAARQVNNSSANQVETISGIDGVETDAFSQYWCSCTVAGTTFQTYVLDTANAVLATADSFGGAGRASDTSGAFPTDFNWRGNHGIGRRIWKGAESASAATSTWFATSTFLSGLRVTLDDA